MFGFWYGMIGAIWSPPLMSLYLMILIQGARSIKKNKELKITDGLALCIYGVFLLFIIAGFLNMWIIDFTANHS